MLPSEPRPLGSGPLHRSLTVAALKRCSGRYLVNDSYLSAVVARRARACRRQPELAALGDRPPLRFVTQHPDHLLDARTGIAVEREPHQPHARGAFGYLSRAAGVDAFLPQIPLDHDRRLAKRIEQKDRLIRFLFRSEFVHPGADDAFVIGAVRPADVPHHTADADETQGDPYDERDPSAPMRGTD